MSLFKYVLFSIPVFTALRNDVSDLKTQNSGEVFIFILFYLLYISLGVHLGVQLGFQLGVRYTQYRMTPNCRLCGEGGATALHLLLANFPSLTMGLSLWQLAPTTTQEQNSFAM